MPNDQAYTLPRTYVALNQVYYGGETDICEFETSDIAGIEYNLEANFIETSDVTVETRKFYKRFYWHGDIDYRNERYVKIDDDGKPICDKNDGYPIFGDRMVLNGQLAEQKNVIATIKENQDNPLYSDVIIDTIEPTSGSTLGYSLKHGKRARNFVITGTLAAEVIVLVVHTLKGLLQLTEMYGAEFNLSNYCLTRKRVLAYIDEVYSIQLCEIS